MLLCLDTLGLVHLTVLAQEKYCDIIWLYVVSTFVPKYMISGCD